LQRVMNAVVYGRETGKKDWIPDRAIGPTDDELYHAEEEYNNQELNRLTGKSLTEIQAMKTGAKRKDLIDLRKEDLRKLIQVYYQERGWTDSGIPTVDTLKKIGLWPFLKEDAQAKIAELAE
jgi:aldehyde:ferredoxin oxidoreductase